MSKFKPRRPTGGHTPDFWVEFRHGENGEIWLAIENTDPRLPRFIDETPPLQEGDASGTFNKLGIRARAYKEGRLQYKGGEAAQLKTEFASLDEQALYAKGVGEVFKALRRNRQK